MINDVRLMGFFGADPEEKETSNGFKYARFPLSLYRSGSQQRGNWIQCEAGFRTGEIVLELGKKRERAIIEGELRVDTWESEEKEFRSRTYIRVKRVIFPDIKMTKSITTNSESENRIEDTGDVSINTSQDTPKSQGEKANPSTITPNKDPFSGLEFEDFDLDS